MPPALALPPPAALTSAAHTLTPAQLGLLCDRAAELSPAAVRSLLAEFAGSLEAVAIYTGRFDTYAHLSALLAELARKHPAVDGDPSLFAGLPLPPVAEPAPAGGEPSAFSVQPSAV